MPFQYAKPETYYETKDADYSPTVIALTGLAVTTAREYEPIWVKERPQAPASQPLTAIQGQVRTISSRLTPTTREFELDMAQDARLRLNTFYFPGWTLYVDSVEHPVEYDNPQGVMEFALPRGQHAVKLVFADTSARTWEYRLTLAALFLLVLSPWLLRFALKEARGTA